MDEPTIVTNNILLGPLSIARDLDSLKGLGISAVVCVAAEGTSFFPDAFNYYEAPELVEHMCGIDDILRILDEVWNL